MKNSRLNPEYFLTREAKLEAASAQVQTKNIFLLTAAEGTGKTGFALALGRKFFDKTIHLRMTAKDKTPANLCVSFYKSLQQNSNGFVCKVMENAELNGITPLETANLMLAASKDFKKQTKTKTLIIIDNFQILPSIGVSCLALMSVLQTAGGVLSFAVCTHRTKGFPPAYAKLNRQTHVIDENILRLSFEEFRELAVGFLKEVPVLPSPERIYDISEGIIGYAAIILNALSAENSETAIGIDFAAKVCSSRFSESLKGLGSGDLNRLLKLSLLPVFTPRFLNKTDPAGNTEKLIEAIYENCAFLTKSREGAYSFGKLFRAWLKKDAMTKLSESERSRFYNLAAEYETERRNLPAVVEYLICAENFDRLEDYLQKNFKDVILNEAKTNLAEIFSSVPADVYRNRAWLPLAFGHILLSVSPDKTKDIFLHTLDTFTAYGNRVGTIISACGLLTYYCTTEGNLKEAERYFIGITSMMSETCDELEEPLKMVVCAAYAQGCFNFKDGNTAVEYLNRAMSVAEKYNIEGFKLYLYVLYVSSFLTVCEKKMAEKYCNLVFRKLGSIKQDSFVRLTVLNLLLHFLAITGQFHAMHPIMNIIRRKYRLHMDHSIRLSAFSDICELEYAFNKGDMELAKMILNRHSESSIKNLPDHMASLILCFKAVVLAYECDDCAGATAEAALKSRQTETNNFFVSFTEAAAGGAFALTGNHKKAILHLTKAANQEKFPQNDNAAICAHSYLSYLYNNLGDRVKAREHAIFAVRLMKKINYTHISGLLPEVLLNVCTYTVNEPSVSAFAAETAYDRINTAFDKNMRPIPVMKITTLNSISISVGYGVLDCTDISGQFRTMLAILLSSPGYTIDQEQIQSYLWTDSSRENARRSFDNLLSRFRKLLSDSFAGIDPKNYITLQNGMLKLHNISCDAVQFNRLIKSAAEYYAKGEYLLTAITVSQAEKLFTGRFFDTLNGLACVEHMQRETDVSFVTMLKLMKSLSYFLPDVFSPEIFFERNLDSFMQETDMVSMAYSYYAQIGKIQKCRKILNDFTAFLESEGYSEAEKAELIYLIKSSGRD